LNRSLAGSRFDLRGRTALVTVSTRSLGRATAQQLARHRARVVITSRKADDRTAVAADLAARGAEVLAHEANLSRKADVLALADAALTHFGQTDIVVWIR